MCYFFWYNINLVVTYYSRGPWKRIGHGECLHGDSTPLHTYKVQMQIHCRYI